MTAQNYTCPSCSAPLTVENRFSRLVVCGYCGQSSLITPKGLDPTGKKGTLADFPSILAIGKTGRMNGREFKVLGRLRYNYEDGFWDEWFLSFADGAKVWLQEDEGEFTAFNKETLTTPLPSFQEIRVGSMVNINNLSAFITEKCRAEIAGAEGELYFRIEPGEKVDCVDGNAGGQLVSVEFTEDEINLSVGKEIPLSDIVLDAHG